MPKYSVSDSGTSSSTATACELCGADSDSLREASVAGATLTVCPDCDTHDDAAADDTPSGPSDEAEDAREDRVQEAVADGATAFYGDSSHWEDGGVNYDDDQLPYLKDEYDDLAQEARQDAGLTQDELADELDVPVNDIMAIETGRAVQANLNASLIAAVETRLEVQLVDPAAN